MWLLGVFLLQIVTICVCWCNPSLCANVSSGDKELYCPNKEQGVYGKGCLWIVPPAFMGSGAAYVQEDVNFLFYRPENSKKNWKGQELMLQWFFGLSHDSLVQEIHELLPTILAFSCSRDRCFHDFVLSRYPGVPSNDVVCAVVNACKATLLKKQNAFDGVLDPDFNSWACYRLPQKMGPCDKAIALCGRHGWCAPGSVWIAKEHKRSVLCYQSDLDPGWLCYRYDLGGYLDWPENWDDELQILKAFSVSDDKCLQDVVGEGKTQHIVEVVKAVFTGRSANLEKDSVFFSWAPMTQSLCQVRRQSTLLIFGDESGFPKGSVWADMLRVGDFIFSYRSFDDIVFQCRVPAGAKGATTKLVGRNAVQCSCYALQGRLGELFVACPSWLRLKKTWCDVVDTFIECGATVVERGVVLRKGNAFKSSFSQKSFVQFPRKEKNVIWRWAHKAVDGMFMWVDDAGDDGRVVFLLFSCKDQLWTLQVSLEKVNPWDGMKITRQRLEAFVRQWKSVDGLTLEATDDVLQSTKLLVEEVSFLLRPVTRQQSSV